MMAPSHGGVIGGDVAAENERKMQYAQGLTAYEPPKSDGPGRTATLLHFLAAKLNDTGKVAY